ncbi:hypothetical protein [Oceanobacillus massiliensis]|uniref:hypothetical protein n=1 Tax=Oceanobacillus massiliensis TaxID=1465765 RepID=UPI003015A6DC
MKFSSTQIKIKSSWLNWKQSIFNKIDYEHFYVYVNLYRFKVNQDNGQDTFITSLGFLRKETGYSTETILNILKDLHRFHIIKVDVSRWDYFIDKDNKKDKVKYNDNSIFTCQTMDKPNLVRVWSDSSGKYEDKRVTDDDFYIPINTSVIDYYRELHTKTKNSRLKPDRLITFYCILNKYNNAEDNKMNMSIFKMAKSIGFSKTLVNNMIEDMNLQGLLRSHKTETIMNRDGFEHVLANKVKAIKEFKIELKHSPNKYQKQLLNKRDDKNKASDKVKGDQDVNIYNIPESFSHKASETNFNPFLDLDQKAIDDDQLDWGGSPYKGEYDDLEWN